MFDQGYADVATTLGRSEDACRQLAARARAHIKDTAPRPRPSADAARRLAEAFRAASIDGDVGSLSAMLAEDVVLYSDGGGKRLAALNPIFGRDRVLRFFAGVATKHEPATWDNLRAISINGAAGLIFRDSSGALETVELDVVDDRIVAIYAVRNPDKLAHVTWPAGPGVSPREPG